MSSHCRAYYLGHRAPIIIMSGHRSLYGHGAEVEEQTREQTKNLFID